MAANRWSALAVQCYDKLPADPTSHSHISPSSRSSLSSDNTSELTIHKIRFDQGTVLTYRSFSADGVILFATYASLTENSDAINDVDAVKADFRVAMCACLLEKCALFFFMWGEGAFFVFLRVDGYGVCPVESPKQRRKGQHAPSTIKALLCRGKPTVDAGTLDFRGGERARAHILTEGQPGAFLHTLASREAEVMVEVSESAERSSQQLELVFSSGGWSAEHLSQWLGLVPVGGGEAALTYRLGLLRHRISSIRYMYLTSLERSEELSYKIPPTHELSGNAINATKLR
ncbi:hypothetical protein K438DRAFT_1952817 [Mycena galopus ATCC 62051]|nr:hypothetical protein K438DRAFT_1952817 [Mycena galopus ATCC 62051]